MQTLTEKQTHARARNKRILRFEELLPNQKEAAVRRVQQLAEKRAEYCGEIWSEPALEIARRSRYLVFRGYIWNVIWTAVPKVLPGTRFGVVKESPAAEPDIFDVARAVLEARGGLGR